MTKDTSIKGLKLEIYDSIDELPIERYHQFNRLLLIEAGVGSDMASYDTHLSRLMGYLKTDDKGNARKEIQNMRQNISFIFEGVSPGMVAFVPLIHAINGDEVTDLSEEGCQETLKVMSEKGMSVGFVRKWVTRLKKKLMGK